MKSNQLRVPLRLRTLVIILTAVGLFLSSQDSLAQARCESLFLPLAKTQAWKGDSATLDYWLRLDVQRTLSADQAEHIFPTSLRTVTTTEKIKNTVSLRIFQVLQFLSARSFFKNSGISFLDTLSKISTRTKNSPFRFLVAGSVFRRIDALLSHPALRDQDGNLSLKRYATFQTQFMSDIRDDKIKYGAEFFDDEAVAQGAINTFAIKLFALFDNHEVYSRQSANAISLLHPVVDAAMDKGSMTKETFKKLERYLVYAERPTIDSAYEHLLFDYLQRFEVDFPRDKVPGFWMALSRLFNAQVKSMKQKQSGFDEQQYYEISLDKGGLSTVLAAYTALGPLTQKQFEFFYRSGGVFQIIDDLMDIQKDQAEGVNTIWTQALSRGESFSKPLRQLLVMEKNIEDHLDELTADFANPKIFQNIYSFGFKLSFIRGLARQRDLVDAPATQLVAKNLSVSLPAIQSIMTAKSLETADGDEGSDVWLLGHLVRMTNAY